jgi:hypothetical protein
MATTERVMSLNTFLFLALQTIHATAVAAVWPSSGGARRAAWPRPPPNPSGMSGARVQGRCGPRTAADGDKRQKGAPCPQQPQDNRGSQGCRSCRGSGGRRARVCAHVKASRRHYGITQIPRVSHAAPSAKNRALEEEMHSRRGGFPFLGAKLSQLISDMGGPPTEPRRAA